MIFITICSRRRLRVRRWVTQQLLIGYLSYPPLTNNQQSLPPKCPKSLASFKSIPRSTILTSLGKSPRLSAISLWMRGILPFCSLNKSMVTRSLVKWSSTKRNSCLKGRIIIGKHLRNKTHYINKGIRIKYKTYSTINLFMSSPPFNPLIKALKSLLSSSIQMCIKSIIWNIILNTKKPMILPHSNIIKTHILTIGFFKKENGKSLETNLFSPTNKFLPNKKMSLNSFLNSSVQMLWLEKISWTCPCLFKSSKTNRFCKNLVKSLDSFLTTLI